MKEYTFTNDTFDEKESSAIKLMNIVLTDKGVYPEDEDYGVGVRYFRHEYLEDYKDDLLENIDSQRTQYLPESNITNVDISGEFKENEKSTLNVVIIFNFNDGQTGLLGLVEKSKKLFYKFVLV